MKIPIAEEQHRDHRAQMPTMPEGLSPAERDMARELGGRRWGSTPRMPIVKAPEES